VAALATALNYVPKTVYNMLDIESFYLRVSELVLFAHNSSFTDACKFELLMSAELQYIYECLVVVQRHKYCPKYCRQ